MPVITHPELPTLGNLLSHFVTRTEKQVGRFCTAIILLMKTGGGRCCLCEKRCGDYGHGLYVAVRDEAERYRNTTYELCERCVAIPVEQLRHHLLALAKEEVGGIERFVAELKVTKDSDGDATVESDAGTLSLGKVCDLLTACEGAIVLETASAGAAMPASRPTAEDRKRPAKRRAAGKAVRS